MTTTQDIKQLLQDIDNNDETMPILEKAMQFYCSTFDKCEGYKHAILDCLDDQYQNHPNEQDPKDLEQLYKLLTN